MTDKIYNPDYLNSLCKNYGLRPSRQYGQNYLINPEVIEKMIEAADVKKTDTIVEVGPGFGVLTFALAEKAKEIIAYEIEKKLIPYWETRSCHCEEAEGRRGNPLSRASRDSSVVALPQNDKTNIKIIWGNILKQQNGFPEQKYKVVANLPYQITSAVIRYFLESDNPPESMTLMVQKEVAERICAKKGDMSVLSVAVQYYAEPKIIGLVPRDNFWPAPKVDSAIIVLKVHKVIKFIKSEDFFRLVKIGFANRRKLLIKNLLPIVGKQNKDKLKETFAKLGLSENVRAQELGMAEWERLSRVIPAKAGIQKDK